jgi:hypothetical protein
LSACRAKASNTPLPALVVGSLDLDRRHRRSSARAARAGCVAGLADVQHDAGGLVLHPRAVAGALRAAFVAASSSRSPVGLALVVGEWRQRPIAGLHAVRTDHVDVVAEAELFQPGERTTGHHGDVHLVERGHGADGWRHPVEQHRIVGVVDDRGEHTVDVEADQHRSGTRREEASDVDRVVVRGHVASLLSRRRPEANPRRRAATGTGRPSPGRRSCGSGRGGRPSGCVVRGGPSRPP